MLKCLGPSGQMPFDDTNWIVFGLVWFGFFIHYKKKAHPKWKLTYSSQASLDILWTWINILSLWWCSLASNSTSKVVGEREWRIKLISNVQVKYENALKTYPCAINPYVSMCNSQAACLRFIPSPQSLHGRHCPSNVFISKTEKGGEMTIWEGTWKEVLNLPQFDKQANVWSYDVCSREKKMKPGTQ